MKYYFLTGRNYDLSKAELLSLLPSYIQSYNIEYLEGLAIIIELKDEFDFSDLFYRLGGFLSFGKIITPEFDFIKNFSQFNKVVFGINIWGDKKDLGYVQIRELGENIKQSFKDNEIAAKFLVSKDLVLNSIEIEKEKIIEKGFLLEILNIRNKQYYGLALGVQNVKSFSELEYDKPYTDKRMGVLPSKLARIMVNLTGLNKGQTLWDPFCGSGTILLEGYSKGINVIGSDISKRSVEMAEENIKWFGNRYNDTSTKFKVFKLDVLKPDSRILSLIRKTQIDAIACEPFMGPPQLNVVPIYRAKKYISDVKKLYSELFKILEHSKLKNFKAVIILPSYKTPQGWATVPINEIASKKWEVINKRFGGHLQYSRLDSIIRRNIFVLYKKH